MEFFILEERLADAFLRGRVNFTQDEFLYFEGAPYVSAAYNKLVWLSKGQDLKFRCGCVLVQDSRGSYKIDGPYGRPWYQTTHEFTSSGNGWHVWLENAGHIYDVAPNGHLIEGLRQEEAMASSHVFYTPPQEATQRVLLAMASRACAPILARMGLPSDAVNLRRTSTGLGIFAKKSYAPGDMILEDAAFVYVPGRGSEAHLNLAKRIRENPCIVASLSSVFGDRVPPVEEDLLVNIVASLNIRSKHPEGVTGLFPTLNFVNHSCAHACDLVTPPDRPDVVQLVARKPIAAGDHLTISYITCFQDGETRDLADMFSKESRCGILQEQYGFKCHCEMCNKN